MPIRETRNLSRRFMEELAMIKFELVGRKPDAADKLPSEFSGGMVKQAALALAPELVFLDEPTSGLDPIGAAEFDELIGTMKQTPGLTVFMLKHDLDSFYSICDRVAALADGRVIAAGSLQAYFHGVRGGRLSGATARIRD